MWLPRDERYLLMAYYICMPELRIEGESFSVYELQCFFIKKPLRIPLVGPKWNIWVNNCLNNIHLRFPIVGPTKVIRLARLLRNKRRNNTESNGGQYNMCEHLEAIKRIEAANDMLKERGFIELNDYKNRIYKIKMNLKGLDLGRKYTSCWSRSGLWFAEYKHHWIWPILTFFAGIIATLIAQWLSKVIM